MKPDEWVTVERSPMEAIAEVVRGRLEAEGIEAVLRGNRVSSCAGPINELNLSWDNPLGGVEVRVHKKDEAAAHAILAEAVEQNPRRVNAPSEGIQMWVALGSGLTAFTVLAALDVRLGIVAGLLVFLGLVLLGSRTRAPRRPSPH
jgi:hypothetical protein